MNTEITLESLSKRIDELLSQFENLKTEIQTNTNTNLKTATERFESIEKQIGTFKTAIDMLDSQVKGLKPPAPGPSPVADNKKKFKFTLLDLAED